MVGGFWSETLVTVDQTLERPNISMSFAVWGGDRGTSVLRFFLSWSSSDATAFENTTSRRQFLQATTQAAAVGAALTATAPQLFAAENGKVKVALVGCGGRGTGSSHERTLGLQRTDPARGHGRCVRPQDEEQLRQPVGAVPQRRPDGRPDRNGSSSGSTPTRRRWTA